MDSQASARHSFCPTQETAKHGIAKPMATAVLTV
jgi:hypothetical protein